MTRKVPPEDLFTPALEIPLSATFLDCHCCHRKKVRTFVCYCRRDTCLLCAWKHQQTCEAAKAGLITPFTQA